MRTLRNVITSYFYRSGFSQGYSFEFEAKKLGILRILTGIVLIIRWGEICLDAYRFSNGYSGLVFIPFALSLFYTIGFLTPITLVLAHAAFYFFDKSFQTVTLGTAIFFILNFVFLFCGAGRKYSIDAWILNRFHWGVRINSLFNRIIVKNENDYGFVYMICFLVYAVVSLGAMSYHIQDPAWTSGETTQILLTNSFLSRQYEFFRSLENAAPAFLKFISVSAGIGQSIFQFLMIPLMIWMVGRRYVIYWGLLFFIFSFFVIQLSYLPHIELILWTAFFFKSKRTGTAVVNPESVFGRLRLFYFFFALFIVYVIIKFPVVSIFSKKIAAEHAVLRKARLLASGFTYAAGMDMPVVFNEADLKMGNCWIVMYRDSTRKELVPIMGKKGERLNYANLDIFYFSNHNSDFLYFRNTLQTGRILIRNRIITPDSRIYSLLKERAVYDQWKTGLKTKTYYYEVLANQQSEVNLPLNERLQITRIDSGTIHIE